MVEAALAALVRLEPAESVVEVAQAASVVEVALAALGPAASAVQVAQAASWWRWRQRFQPANRALRSVRGQGGLRRAAEAHCRALRRALQRVLAGRFGAPTFRSAA